MQPQWCLLYHFNMLMQQKFHNIFVTVTHNHLTHWGRVTQICVGNLTIIGPDNGLSPGQREAIFWTNAGILLIGPLGINFSEILIEIHTFSFKKKRFKLSSGKRWPFCLGLNELRPIINTQANKYNSNTILNFEVMPECMEYIFQN